VITSLVGWINQLPEPLIRTAVIMGGLALAFAAIAGPILLFIGFLPQMIIGINLLIAGLATLRGILMGPVGIATVAAAVAAGLGAFAALQAVGSSQGSETVTIPEIPSFQGGGTMGSTGMALVGERGPELVRLPAASQVISNSRSTNYNVTANYTRPQVPQSIRLDLEALAMMARR